ILCGLQRRAVADRRAAGRGYRRTAPGRRSPPGTQLAECDHVTSAPTPLSEPRPPDPRMRPGPGLRARIWLACLFLALSGAAAALWVAATRAPAGALYDPAALGAGPWAAALTCLVLGVALAGWL